MTQGGGKPSSTLQPQGGGKGGAGPQGPQQMPAQQPGGGMSAAVMPQPTPPSPQGGGKGGQGPQQMPAVQPGGGMGAAVMPQPAPSTPQGGGKGGQGPQQTPMNPAYGLNPDRNNRQSLLGYGGKDLTRWDFEGPGGQGQWGSGITGMTGGPLGMFGIMPGGIHPGSMYEGRDSFNANDMIHRPGGQDLSGVADKGAISPSPSTPGGGNTGPGTFVPGVGWTPNPNWRQ